ncbi:hypothetical protein K474DRAFT_1610198, partial [Panus rudis PR-1116 ss-1]
MAAFLRSKGLYRIATGAAKTPKSDDPKLEDYLEKREQAAGYLVLAVDRDQRVHLAGLEDDPTAIWTKLEQVHMNKQAGTHFNAYDDLFSIRLGENESLTSLITKVDDVMLRIQGLRPSDFTLEKMDDELAIMALVRALPHETYGSFVSSLLL